jgi:hypothetical protein
MSRESYASKCVLMYDSHVKSNEMFWSKYELQLSSISPWNWILH